MNVVISQNARKQLDRINEPTVTRISEALFKLGKEPPQGDIKKMKGLDSYRVRVGGYRIIYDIINNEIVVNKIAPRGQIYKRR